MKTTQKLAAVIGACVVLGSCNRQSPDNAAAHDTDSDWKNAQQSGTTTAYTNYLEKHPYGIHTEEANVAIETIVWKDAQFKNSVEAYRTYLKQYADGHYVVDARKACETFDKLIKENLIAATKGKLIGTWRQAEQEFEMSFDSAGTYIQVWPSAGGSSGFKTTAVIGGTFRLDVDKASGNIQLYATCPPIWGQEEKLHFAILRIDASTLENCFYKNDGS